VQPTELLCSEQVLCKAPRTRVRGRKETDAERSEATNERGGAIQERRDKRSILDLGMARRS
jgi:hypothetical protein